MSRLFWTIKQRIKKRIQSFIEPLIDDRIEQRLAIRSQLNEYEHAAESEKASFWENRFNAHELADRFRKMSVDVEEHAIRIQDFDTWMTAYPSLVAFYRDFGDARIEKLLEHYLTLTYLDVKPSDIFIDVAAAQSPLSQILRKQGMQAYCQDLIYAHGIHGYKIGSDAAEMPIPNGFADILTLHCAFECFQGDADIRFAQAISRFLKTQGRMGIIPLYVDTIHFVKTSPYCHKHSIQVEPEAKWLWRDDQYREPFSRHYSPESFQKRILMNMPQMKHTILFFTNTDEVAQYYHGQRIYCYFMFKGEKT